MVILIYHLILNKSVTLINHLIVLNDRSDVFLTIQSQLSIDMNFTEYCEKSFIFYE